MELDRAPRLPGVSHGQRTSWSETVNGLNASTPGRFRNLRFPSDLGRNRVHEAAIARDNVPCSGSFVDNACVRDPGAAHGQILGLQPAPREASEEDAHSASGRSVSARSDSGDPSLRESAGEPRERSSTTCTREFRLSCSTPYVQGPVSGPRGFPPRTAYGRAPTSRDSRFGSAHSASAMISASMATAPRRVGMTSVMSTTGSGDPTT